MPAAKNLIELTPDGRLQLHFHAGQWRAWESEKRFILALAGWQSGKTVIGPPWLWREMGRRGPGDYLVASPSHPLMTKKVLPEFLRFFKRLLRLGDYVGGSKKIFTFSELGCMRTFGVVPDDPPQVFFGHASDPDSLESATCKAAWLDECGQKAFRLASFEAILGRLSLAQGRVLMTSRPYDLGWMKQRVYDPWEKAHRNHREIEVVNFKSIDNPAFSREEYERARREMPLWKFLMNYDGVFTRPAGRIYDAFNEKLHKIPRFEIPPNWVRLLGLDFGGVNTAGVFYAVEPGTYRLFAYREYGPVGSRSAREHVAHLLAGEPMIPFCVGGSKSEGQWRQEFAQAGLPVAEPIITEVEVGIDRVYSAHRKGQIMVFDDLAGYLDEKLSYSREVDAAGEPTEKIENKESYHLLDAERYIVSYYNDPAVWAAEDNRLLVLTA